MKRTLLLCLILCVAATAGGCACNPWVFGPLGPGTVCDASGGYGGACGAAACGPVACVSTCGPVCNDCGVACGGACSEPCETACGQCDGTSCAVCCPPYGPLTWLFTLLSHGYCGPSCGEVWWGDWHGAPPDCGDPCDRCGDYTGRGAPACESCGTGFAGQANQVGTPHAVARRTNRNVANRHRRTNGYVAGRQIGTKPAGDQITETSSKYAPRLISVSDKVVDTSRPGSVPQATLPQRMPAHR
jgi:hypothetical protein